MALCAELNKLKDSNLKLVQVLLNKVNKTPNNEPNTNMNDDKQNKGKKKIKAKMKRARTSGPGKIPKPEAYGDSGL